MAKDGDARGVFTLPGLTGSAEVFGSKKLSCFFNFNLTFYKK